MTVRRQLTNEYTDTLGAFYWDIPKSVFAAIAISMLTDGGDRLADAREEIEREWWMLHLAGIVPQRPPGARP